MLTQIEIGYWSDNVADENTKKPARCYFDFFCCSAVVVVVHCLFRPILNQCNVLSLFLHLSLTRSQWASIVWLKRRSARITRTYFNAIEFACLADVHSLVFSSIHDVLLYSGCSSILFYNSARFLIKFRYCDCINWSLRSSSFFQRENGFCMHLPFSSNSDRSGDYIENGFDFLPQSFNK